MLMLNKFLFTSMIIMVLFLLSMPLSEFFPSLLPILIGGVVGFGIVALLLLAVCVWKEV